MKKEKKGMEKIPEGITICHLECLLMENGEIISDGKSIGWFENLKEFLTPIRNGLTGEEIK